MRFLMWLCLLAAPVRAAERIVVLQLTPGGEGTEALVAPLTEQVLTEAQRLGFVVVGQSDLAAVLGLERQRELLGCAAGSSSCYAELSGALGASLLMTGSVSRVGQTFRVDLKLIDAATGNVLRREGKMVSATGVYSALSELVPALLAEVGPRPRPARPGPWVLGAVCGAVALGGGVALVFGFRDAASVNANPERYSYGAARARLDTDGLLATAGLLALSVGAAGVVGALLWGLLGGPGEARVTAAVGLAPGGAGLLLGGAW